MAQRSQGDREKAFQIEDQRAVFAGKPAPGSPLFELMRQARITCVGDVVEHDAAVCIDCERLVGCWPSADGGGVVVRCWVEREAHPERTTWAGPECSACRDRTEVAPHPRMPAVPICRECLEVSREPIDYLELGVGD